MDDHDDDLVAARLLRLGRIRVHDLEEGGSLLAAVRDWQYAGEDLREPDTIRRFCDVHVCTADVLARLLVTGRTP